MMIVTLEIKPEIEDRLRRRAEREGQDVTAFLQAVVEREAEEEMEEAEGSAYDLFAGRLGGVRSGGSSRAVEASSNNGADAAAGAEQAAKNRAALEALRAWREQNATDDPDTLAHRQKDWEELKQALNESHTSGRVLFP